MKKLFLACVGVLLALPVFAITLTGTVVDSLENPAKKIELVSVVVNDDEDADTDRDGKFTIENFNPLLPPQSITFSKDEYLEQTHKISLKNDIELFFDDNPQPFQKVFFIEDENGKSIPDPTNEIQLPTIDLTLAPVEIIRGKITADKDGVPEDIVKENLSIEVNGAGPVSYEIIDNNDTAPEYEYIIKGYFGTAEKSRNYSFQSRWLSDF